MDAFGSRDKDRKKLWRPAFPQRARPRTVWLVRQLQERRRDGTLLVLDGPLLPSRPTFHGQVHNPSGPMWKALLCPSNGMFSGEALMI